MATVGISHHRICPLTEPVSNSIHCIHRLIVTLSASLQHRCTTSPVGHTQPDPQHGLSEYLLCKSHGHVFLRGVGSRRLLRVSPALCNATNTQTTDQFVKWRHNSSGDPPLQTRELFCASQIQSLWMLMLFFGTHRHYPINYPRLKMIYNILLLVQIITAPGVLCLWSTLLPPSFHMVKQQLKVCLLTISLCLRHRWYQRNTIGLVRYQSLLLLIQVAFYIDRYHGIIVEEEIFANYCYAVNTWNGTSIVDKANII